MVPRHDPVEELHGIKARLAHLKEDLHKVMAETAATVRHYGHWNHENAKEMVDDIDARLGRAIAGLEAKMADVEPERRDGYRDAMASLATLRSGLESDYAKMGHGTADHETIHVVQEFHNRIDEHLEYLRHHHRDW